ncbi:EGF-like domain protein [Trichuris suis]|nr:EGF-like domain protein [Trichuris suis]
MDPTKILLLAAFLELQTVDRSYALLNPVKEPHLLLPVDAGATNVNDRKSSAKGPPLLLPPTLTGIVPPGGICSNDEDCSGFPFAYCMSNCMCKDYAINAGSTCLEAGSMAEGNCGVDQVYVSEAGICMNVAKPGAPCQYSQQCSGTEVGAFCINMRCRCVYGMRTTDTGRCTFINTNCTRRGMIWIAELGECKPVVAPGARPCTHRQQCTASYQDSVCFMTQCTCPPETPIAVDGTCGISCPAGRTYSGVLNRCVQAIQPGGRCQYSSQCHALNPGMICQRSICRCPKEYVWTGKQCSESCPEGYRENPENGICRPACREGQVEHAGKCLNQVPPDSPCAISAQCTGGSSCVDGLCRCPYGMYNLQGICSRAKSRPGGSCAKGEECTDNSYCLDGRCVCVRGTVLHNQRCATPTIVPPDSICGPMIECGGGSICVNNVCTCPNGHISINHQCQLPDAVSPGQKCREDVDICTGRSYCVDGICQCPPHMVIERSICIMPAIGKSKVEDNSQCTIQRIKVAPGSVCDKTRRCGGGSTCQLGECKCPEGMIIIDQRCQLAKTAPPTYSCRNDEVCTGGSFCLNGICTCPKGQIPINEVCKSEKAYLTGRCDHDKDCKNGFACIGGRCSCSGMLLPNGECKVSRLVSPGGKCVLGMDVCSGGSSCISNVCACPTGFYPSSGHCRNRKRGPFPIDNSHVLLLVVPYSFTCSTSTDCAGGASCYSGVCICPTQMLQIDGQCQPLLVFPLNGSVETMFMQREPVYTTIYHSSSVHVNGSAQQFAKPLWSTCKSDDFCANGTECIDGICQCPDGYIAVNLTCRLKFSVSPGESCSPSELCSDGSQCIRGKCTCPEGYDLVNKRCHSSKQRQPASPGDACSISTICTGGSSCRAGICKCDFGFEVRQGMCVRRADTISLARPGERCVQEATNCTGGSRCVFGTCKCPKGTVAKNKRCEAATTLSDWALPGQPCDADAECRGGSKCIGSLCTCPVNQVVINHECADAHVTVKPGYACDANSICTGGSTCTSGVCRCPLGQSIEGHHCVARMAIGEYFFQSYNTFLIVACAFRVSY